MINLIPGDHPPQSSSSDVDPSYTQPQPEMPSCEFQSEIQSMSQDSNQNCIMQICNQIFNWIKNLLNCLCPKLFSSSPSHPFTSIPQETNPSTTFTPILSTEGPATSIVTQSNDRLSLSYRIQKGQEILSDHFSHNPYLHPSENRDDLSCFDPSLDPRSFATIVKFHYNNQEEGYMAEQSLPNGRTFFEGKMVEFLTKHRSKNEGVFEVQTIFVQRLNNFDIAHKIFCSSIAFPSADIQSVLPLKPFTEYDKMPHLSPIIRFGHYLYETFSSCSNSGEALPEDPLHRRTFSGNCATQLRRQLTNLFNPNRRV